MKKVTIIILIFVVGLLTLQKAYNYYFSNPFTIEKAHRSISITTGDSFKKISRNLSEQGIIPSRFIFTFLAKIERVEGRIKAGEYEIPSPTSYQEIFTILMSGKSITYKITIPEGYNIYEIAGLLVQNKIIESKDAFIEKAFDPEIIAHYKINNISCEGYLYPETYFLTKKMSVTEIIDIFVTEFQKHMTPLFMKRATEIGFTVNEVITLASIIEKETSLPSERPLISSVFHNRLQKKMRLQTDPTVIYGIPGFDGNIRKEDLFRKTPYNTYVNSGLPLGPIANPSVASIEAALYPRDTAYLYFVSKGDGSHHFSATLADHNKAVKRYQLRQINN